MEDHKNLSSLMISELEIMGCTPKMIFETSCSEQWTKDDIEKLGDQFLSHLRENQLQSSPIHNNFSLSVQMAFYKYIAMLLGEKNNVIKVCHEVVRRDDNITDDITTRINYKKYKNNADKILDSLNETEKKVLFRYFFIQDDISPNQARELLNGLDFTIIDEAVEKLNNLFRLHFAPKSFEDAVEFLEMFTKLPDVAPSLIDIQDNILTHPIITFLDKVSDCLPYDILQKYHSGSLKDLTKKFVGPHVDNCPNCQKRIESLAIDSRINFDSSKQCSELCKSIINKEVENGKISTLQIWTTKNCIKLCNEEIFTTFYPYCVLIVTEAEQKLNDEPIIRVQPISTITDFKSMGDVFIDDLEYIGESFIVETWNEQPMQVSGLENYICTIDKNILHNNLINNKTSNYPPKIISHFRSLELKNTTYLRGPVMDMLHNPLYD